MKPSKTIVRRDLTYADLTNNAKEIFEGKVPSAIGKRVENPGF